MRPRARPHHLRATLLAVALLLPVVLNACAASGITLQAPADNATLDTLNPTLAWQAVAGATTYAILLTRPDNSHLTLTASEARLTLRALEVGQRYGWQVLGGGQASATRHFTIGSDVRPGAPILDSDRGGLPNGGSAQGVLFLHWHPSGALTYGPHSAWQSGGDSYQFQVFNPDGSRLYDEYLPPYMAGPGGPVQLNLDSVGLTTYEDINWGTLGIVCGEAYSWRVRQMRGGPVVEQPNPSVAATAQAQNIAAARSAASEWSAAWTFIVPNPPAGAPSLTAPANGAEISGGALTWTPVASGTPGATVIYVYQMAASPSGPWSSFGSARTQSSDLRPGEITDLSLENGQRYYWRVRAAYPGSVYSREGLCPGPWSSVRSFVWRGPTIRPTGGMPPPSPVCPPEGCDAPPGPSPTVPTPTTVPTRTPRPPRVGPTGLGDLFAGLFSPPTATPTPWAPFIPYFFVVTSTPTVTLTASPTASATSTSSPTPTSSRTPSPTPTRAPPRPPTATASPQPTVLPDTDTPAPGNDHAQPTDVPTKEPDADGDGIPDSQDKCPKDPKC